MIEDVMGRMQQEAVLDSQGEFTLDLRAEASKMALFVQQEPVLWLLKGVQAAVASGASEVQIRLSRSRFELGFEPSPEAGRASLEGESTWGRHLRMAVTLALAGPGLGVELSHGDQTLLGSPPASPGVCLRVLRPKRSWWQFSDPELAAVSRGLTLRCAFSPIPVRVDRRDILLAAPESCPALGSTRPRLSFGEGVTAVPWLAEAWWLAEGGASFSLHPPLRRSPSELRVGGARVPGSADQEFPLGPRVSCLGWLRTSLQFQSLAAVEDGPTVRTYQLLESLLAGAASQLPEVEVLGLGFELLRVGRNEVRVETLTVAELSPEQLVPGPADPRRLDFARARCQRWVGLCSSGQAQGGLFLVQDGVLLNPLRGWSAHPGTTVLVATSGQATDLGQLNLVQNEGLESLLEQARRDELELAADIQGMVHSASECERLGVPLLTREHWRRALPG